MNAQAKGGETNSQHVKVMHLSMSVMAGVLGNCQQLGVVRSPYRLAYS
jgi:hypothetical protein